MDIRKVQISCSDLPSIMQDEAKPLTELQNEEFKRLKSKKRSGTITASQRSRLIELNERQKAYNSASTFTNEAKLAIKDIYVKEKYNKYPVNTYNSNGIPMMNGVLNESASLKMVMELNNEEYKVDKSLISSKHVKGILDAYTGKSIKNADKVLEIKTAVSMQSLLQSLVNKEVLMTKYKWQAVGYLYLTGANECEIYHVLPSYAPEIVTQLINRYLAKVKGLGLPKNDVNAEINKIKQMTNFDEIPIQERIVKFSIKRDASDIKRMIKKCIEAKKYMKKLSELHKNQFS